MKAVDGLDQATSIYSSGNFALASEYCQKILDKDPYNADAWHLLGLIAHQLGQDEFAQTLIKNAILLNNNNADFYNNLGRVYFSTGNFQAAEINYLNAIKIQSNHTKSLSNLAGLFRTTGDLNKAIEYGRLASKSDPSDHESRVNLGNVLKDQKQIELAIKEYRSAINLKPDFALAHWNLSLALLSIGQFEEGFKEMTWRWKWSGFPSIERKFKEPKLDISTDLNIIIKPIKLYIYPEQGLGDTIQFLRFGKILRTKKVFSLFECPTELLPIIEHSHLFDKVVTQGDVLPDFDFHMSLMDLPYHTRIDIKNLPQKVPYIRLPSDIRDKWFRKLKKYKEFKIGLNWQGNSRNPLEKFRSLKIEDLNPLSKVKNVTWFNLQKTSDRDNFTEISKLFLFNQKGPEPLSELAGLINSLDLIITNDTAIAHLAGALGKPVWVLLHYSADWRWNLQESQSLWYPTAKLFKQSVWGQWGDVIDAVMRELQKKN